MITTLLIANRGEIACRIIRTAKRLGIRTIAIYSDADAHNPHVHLADEAYRVGPSIARESYLNIENIIEIAKKTNASAIHPGYGFLSENPEFATACEKANVIFIGPSVLAMKAMASKKVAKQLLEKTNVPLTPGYHGEAQSPEELCKEAKKIGFPVLLKAAMGGGGKGMRAVYNENDFETALHAAKREAQAYFKDETMLIEKLIEKPRHIEIQLMADHHGNVIHLFERDCSIQRRHQKIIEEAPAPNLSQTLRQALADAAITVAQTIDYRGAGTVEFLVDGVSGAFYFMEMNTRLQVEHPVTEMITGLDLVEWQLHIAENKPLPITQDQVSYQGHAIECRIYAEDPLQGFIPSVGKIRFLHPPQGEGIRVDSGVEANSHVSQFYDAMFAKLIVFGNNRAQALQRLDQALTSYYVAGVKTNLSFLKSIVREPDFAAGHFSTDFLETHALKTQTDPHALFFAAAFEYLKLIPADPLFKATFGWSANLHRHWTKRYRIEGESFEMKITAKGLNTFELQDGKTSSVLEIETLTANTLQLTFAHQKIKATLFEDEGHTLYIFTPLGTTVVEIEQTRYDLPEHDKNHGLIAPMPSTVVAVLKQVGDTIQKGESLMVLEAMKMEHTIYAPDSGRLNTIFFNVGSQVHEGALLASLSPLHEPENQG